MPPVIAAVRSGGSASQPAVSTADPPADRALLDTTATKLEVHSPYCSEKRQRHKAAISERRLLQSKECSWTFFISAPSVNKDRKRARLADEVDGTVSLLSSGSSGDNNGGGGVHLHAALAAPLCQCHDRTGWLVLDEWQRAGAKHGGGGVRFPHGGVRGRHRQSVGIRGCVRFMLSFPGDYDAVQPRYKLPRYFIKMAAGRSKRAC